MASPFKCIFKALNIPYFHAGCTIEQCFALGHLNSNLLSRFRFQIFLTHTKKEIAIDLNKIRSTNPYS